MASPVIAQDIIFGNLSTPTVPGVSSPIVGTRSDLRLGSRSGGAPDPDPDPPPATGMDPWGIAPDGGGGGAGHLGGPYKVPAAGLYDMNNIQYLGAFLATEGGGPYVDPPSNRFGAMFNSSGQIGFNPPNGNNGVYGSIFVAGHPHYRQMIELQVPAILSDPSENDSYQLPVATNVGPMFDLQTLMSSTFNLGSTDVYFVGMMVSAHGKVFVTAYANYPASGDLHANKTLVIEDASDIHNSAVSGQVTYAPGSRGNLWGAPVPAEHHSLIGADWTTGAGGRASISSRQSQGPSMYAAGFSDYSPGDTEISSIKHLSYDHPYSMHITSFPDIPNEWEAGYPGDYFNEAALKWYANQLGITAKGDHRNPDFQPNTYAEWARSSPRTEFEDLGYRPDTVANDMYTIASGANFGFIVPGTRTYLTFGRMTGRRYGLLYKVMTFDGSISHGGSPLDKSDMDNYFWAYDVNDLVGQTNPWDAVPYDYGVFENNRWLQKPNKWGIPWGDISSGAFDPVNRRLYLSHAKGHGGSGVVISVYQV